MIRHCVFVRFRPDIPSAVRATIFGDIASVAERMPGLVAAHVGANVSPEHGMDKGFSEGFILDFLDAGARDAYLIDPEHQRIGARLVAAADSGADGIFVYDLQIS
ncbi:Dabb family protein [Nocardioides zeicaulis]|uniref:Dabb family protein n=1 Tax=Nocardioides zeicaulis TaxID=1776857 RepID=A0ABV6DWP7_9ACTN